MVYVFLAQGFEEMEALSPVDILRRAEIEVATVGIGGNLVKGSHGIPVLTDLDENEFTDYSDIEMIVLPGGMPGTLNLDASRKVHEVIDYCVKNGKYVAAICAAPSILGRKGLLNGKNAVCFEGYESQLFGANVLYDSVCRDGNIITARGAGVAVEFGLKLVETLVSKERSDLLGASMLCAEK
jgi:4-methyl-5(b-hydroxyethyl)-thiazole monophosphate biosynthesis